MGACCSSPAADRPAAAGGGGGKPARRAAAACGDSAGSLPEQPGRRTASSGAPGTKGAGAGGGGRGATRVVQTDLVTGEALPDLGVEGVFDVITELGSGGSGRTFLCRDLGSARLVAVKFIPRPLAKAAVPFLLAEVDVQAELGEGSLSLVAVHEMVLTRSHLALVLEYAAGGCMTHHVSALWESALQRGGLFMDEREASYFLRQFMAATHYCHRHHVAHRDLKLDNTLLDAAPGGGPQRLKICDFGFAKRWGASEANMHTAIGTPCYMSPQMLAARQCATGYSGLKADMWAAGILLFVMLLGSFPFDHTTTEDPDGGGAASEVWLRQQQAGWRRSPRAADVLARGLLSESVCDLLDRLLEMDEDKRLTSEEAMRHPWLNLPLEPEQQAAWERLQAEQAALDAKMREGRDPRLAKMRRDAMLAMMAVATKPPGPTLLPEVGAPLGGGGGGGGGGLGAAAGSLSAHSSDGVASTPFSEAAAGGAPAGEGPDTCLQDRSRHDSRHLSFLGGEGVRPGGMEHKVEAYRQRDEQQRQARVAAGSAPAGREDGGRKRRARRAKAAPGGGEPGGGADGADGAGRDDVWRLPLLDATDPAVYRLSPELSVAAGALVKQLQASGSKVAGRGRANRSSCPMY